MENTITFLVQGLEIRVHLGLGRGICTNVDTRLGINQLSSVTKNNSVVPIMNKTSTWL